MTVAELIEVLNEVDPQAPIYFDDDEELFSLNVLVDENFEQTAVYFCRGEVA